MPRRKERIQSRTGNFGVCGLLLWTFSVAYAVDCHIDFPPRLLRQEDTADKVVTSTLLELTTLQSQVRSSSERQGPLLAQILAENEKFMVGTHDAELCFYLLPLHIDRTTIGLVVYGS